MPLESALNLVTEQTGDTVPISARLVKNIGQILASSTPDPDSYDVGAVFTAVVYAIRMLESKVEHHETLHTALRGQITALHKRIVELESNLAAAGISSE